MFYANITLMTSQHSYVFIPFCSSSNGALSDLRVTSGITVDTDAYSQPPVVYYINNCQGTEILSHNFDRCYKTTVKRC
jgi:hypothetical protein